MPGRDCLVEDDRAGRNGARDGQEQERVRAEETLPQLPEARHGGSIGQERRNPGRFRYESGMNAARIPPAREEDGYPGGPG